MAEVTRREFLRLAGLSAVGAAVVAVTGQAKAAPRPAPVEALPPQLVTGWGVLWQIPAAVPLRKTLFPLVMGNP